MEDTLYEPEKLLDLAHKACEAAVREGAEQAETWAGAGKSTSVVLEKSAIKSSDVRTSGSIAVRAYFRGGVGYASTDKLDEDAILGTARSAAQLAKLAEPDPDFISLPGPGSYPSVAGLFDPKIAEMDVRDIINSCIAQLDAAKDVTAEANVSGGASVAWSNWAVANSLGVGASGKNSFLGMFTMVIVRRGDDVGTFYDFDQARLLSDFDPSGLGKSAAEMALRFLGARKIETKVMPVVLGPLAGLSVFYEVARSANAEDVQRNRSFLIGMRGEKIGSDVLTLVDDPLIPGGLSSRECDAEGFPSRRTPIMEGGVLLTYLHNSYTANKAKEPNTGHAGRGGIGPTNIVPKLGAKTGDQIISEIDEGLYVNEGGIHANPVTGEVSASVDFGFKIEKGELAYPVQNTMIGGNFLDMLANIDAISSDYRSEPGLIMPTIRIQGVSVAGGK